MAAALELIREVGPAAFTLREVARRAGISHNAPYRHFREKDELLAAVATTGFERLAKQLARPGTIPPHVRKPALLRFHASGVAYVQFALKSPEHFLVMFDWPLEADRYPELATSATCAFSVLVGLVQAAQREGSLPGGDPHGIACIAWSLVHGVAKLAIAKKLPFQSMVEVLSFTKRAIEALQGGLSRGAPWKN
ncbi:MAG TPA: TetR/AcrR family transcriptional regulator [Bryobacteraceae bacterium]|nr:TetR/AcrR family transcriptional regulator [Bryobacteraceae bacterium]